jgi:hypothetical protein
LAGRRRLDATSRPTSTWDVPALVIHPSTVLVSPMTIAHHEGGPEVVDGHVGKNRPGQRDDKRLAHDGEEKDTSPAEPDRRPDQHGLDEYADDTHDGREDQRTIRSIRVESPAATSHRSTQQAP